MNQDKIYMSRCFELARSGSYYVAPNPMVGCVIVHKDVIIGEGRNVNRRFFTFHEKKRPYILLKWAQSADGYLDMERNDSVTRINWISNEKCKRLSHIWRAEESAILVGKNTVLLDDPTLTTREVEGPNPIRILIDTENNLYSEQGEKRWNIFNDQANTLVFNYREERKVENIEWIKLNKGEDFLKQLLSTLFERNIQSVIIEGGRFTLDRFIENDLWDEARVIRGLPFFCNGVKAPELKLRPIISEILGGDHIDYYKNP